MVFFIFTPHGTSKDFVEYALQVTQNNGFWRLQIRVFPVGTPKIKDERLLVFLFALFIFYLGKFAKICTISSSVSAKLLSIHMRIIPAQLPENIAR